MVASFSPTPFTRMGMLTFTVGQPLVMESSPNNGNKTQLLKNVTKHPISPQLKMQKTAPSFRPQIHRIINPQNKGSYLHTTYMHVFGAFCFLARMELQSLAHVSDKNFCCYFAQILALDLFTCMDGQRAYLQEKKNIF